MPEGIVISEKEDYRQLCAELREMGLMSVADIIERQEAQLADANELIAAAQERSERVSALRRQYLRHQANRIAELQAKLSACDDHAADNERLRRTLELELARSAGLEAALRISIEAAHGVKP